MATNRGLLAVIKRYQTLMLFGILVGSSSAFVACGSDDDVQPPPGRAGTAGTAGRDAAGGRGGDATTTDTGTSSLEDEEELEEPLEE